MGVIFIVLLTSSRLMLKLLAGLLEREWASERVEHHSQPLETHIQAFKLA